MCHNYEKLEAVSSVHLSWSMISSWAAPASQTGTTCSKATYNNHMRVWQVKQRIWLVPQQQYCNNTTWVWLLLSWGQLFRFDLSLMLLIAWSRCPPLGYLFKTLLNMTLLGTPRCKVMASRCFLLSSTNKQIVFLVIWPGTVKQGHTCAGKVNLIQLLICPVP